MPITSNENNTKTLLNGNDISIIDGTIMQPLMDIVKTFINEPALAIKALQSCINDMQSKNDTKLFSEADIIDSILQIYTIYSDSKPQNLLNLQQRDSKANAASIRLHITSKIDRLIETLKKLQKNSLLQSFIIENLASFKDLIDAIELAELTSLSIKDLTKLILKPDDVYRLVHKANMPIHAILNLNKFTRELLLEHSAVIGKLQDEVHIAWHRLISFPTDKFHFVLKNVGAFASLAKHDSSVSDQIITSSLDELESLINPPKPKIPKVYFLKQAPKLHRKPAYDLGHYEVKKSPSTFLEPTQIDFGFTQSGDGSSSDENNPNNPNNQPYHYEPSRLAFRDDSSDEEELYFHSDVRTDRAEGNSSLNNNNNFGAQKSAVTFTQTTSANASLPEPEPDTHPSNIHSQLNNSSVLFQPSRITFAIAAFLSQHPKLSLAAFNQIWPENQVFTEAHADLVEILIDYKENTVVMALHEVRGKTERQALQEIFLYKNIVSERFSYN